MHPSRTLAVHRGLSPGGSPRNRRRLRRPLPRSTAALALILLLPMLTLGCFRPSNHTTALRDSVLEAVGDGWTKEIELGVGPLTLGLARGGSRFLELPNEARTVLRAMRGADVGIYRPRAANGATPAAELLHAADGAMAKRGWERCVAVVKSDETVALYVPGELDAKRQLRLCVLVVNPSEMVIVSARGRPEPLIELVLEEIHDASPKML